MTMPGAARFVERTSCIQCGGNRLTELCSGRYDEGLVKTIIESDPWGEHPAPFLVGHRWVYVRCDDCAQAFHRSVLSPEWNERRYTRWMTQEAIAAFEAKIITPQTVLRYGTTHAMHALRIERLTRTIRGADPVRVLDFGCGYGAFLSMCAAFGFDGTGVDRSLARRGHGVYKILPEISDVQGLQFHALTLFEVLEHLDDPMAVLSQLVKLVAPGGVLVLETPDCEGVDRIETMAQFRKIAPMEHINGFTAKTLTSFAKRVGFERIRAPVAWVTADGNRVVKSMAKYALAPVRRDSTQQYFTKPRTAR